MVQKPQQNDFKLIKLRTTTSDELDKLIKNIETKQPYLKGRISYNSVVLMLIGKKNIKLSKYNFLRIAGK